MKEMCSLTSSPLPQLSVAQTLSNLTILRVTGSWVRVWERG